MGSSNDSRPSATSASTASASATLSYEEWKAQQASASAAGVIDKRSALVLPVCPHPAWKVNLLMDTILTILPVYAIDPAILESATPEELTELTGFSHFLNDRAASYHVTTKDHWSEEAESLIRDYQWKGRKVFYCVAILFHGMGIHVINDLFNNRALTDTKNHPAFSGYTSQELHKLMPFFKENALLRHFEWDCFQKRNWTNALGNKNALAVFEPPRVSTQVRDIPSSTPADELKRIQYYCWPRQHELSSTIVQRGIKTDAYDFVGLIHANILKESFSAVRATSYDYFNSLEAFVDCAKTISGTPFRSPRNRLPIGGDTTKLTDEWNIYRTSIAEYVYDPAALKMFWNVPEVNFQLRFLRESSTSSSSAVASANSSPAKSAPVFTKPGNGGFKGRK